MNKLLLLPVLFLLISSCKKEPNDPCLNSASINALKINEIQSIGSHNSYRVRTYQPIYEFVQSILPLIPEEYDPSEWDYTHVPIPEQLETYNMRSLELDIHHDPEGGRYYHRMGLAFVGEDTESYIPELQEPGMKLIHIADVDYQTNHIRFKDALEAIKSWSHDNPNHIPITIMVEFKTETIKDHQPGLNLVSALPFTKGALDSVDMEIKDVFGEDLISVITPTEVKGNYNSIREAVLAGNWPILKNARGKVLFVCMAENQEIADYLDGHPHLNGRAMFYFADENDSNCAFVKYDNPITSQAEIKNAVLSGFMVRTRADAGTTQARTGDYSRYNSALSSGAQIISTDYYKADYRADTSSNWSDYHVQLDEGAARFNPVNVPEFNSGCSIE